MSCHIPIGLLREDIVLTLCPSSESCIGCCSLLVVQHVEEHPVYSTPLEWSGITSCIEIDDIQKVAIVDRRKKDCLKKNPPPHGACQGCIRSFHQIFQFGPTSAKTCYVSIHTIKMIMLHTARRNEQQRTFFSIWASCIDLIPIIAFSIRFGRIIICDATSPAF